LISLILGLSTAVVKFAYSRVYRRDCGLLSERLFPGKSLFSFQSYLVSFNLFNLKIVAYESSGVGFPVTEILSEFDELEELTSEAMSSTNSS